MCSLYGNEKRKEHNWQTVLNIDLPEGLGWGKRESINLKSLFSRGILEFILSKHTCTPM